MLRCAELNLSDAALNGMSIGMIYDMLIEKGNDQEINNFEVHIQPPVTQEDIDRFFPA